MFEQKRVGFSQFSHNSVLVTMFRSFFYPLTSPNITVSFLVFACAFLVRWINKDPAPKKAKVSISSIILRDVVKNVERLCMHVYINESHICCQHLLPLRQMLPRGTMSIYMLPTNVDSCTMALSFSIPVITRSAYEKHRSDNLHCDTNDRCGLAQTKWGCGPSLFG